MPWGAAIAAAAAIGGSLIQSHAAGKAADSQQQASQDAIAEQQRQFDQMRGDLQPYMGAGTNALAQLGQVNAGDYSGFDKAPDYLYVKDAAQYAIEHSAANAGSLYSGGTSLDLGREIAGIASQNFSSYRNNLMALAGMGQASAAGVGAQGMGMANNVGGYLTNAGNAAAGGYLANGDNQANLLNQLGQAGASYFGGQGGIAANGSAGGYAPNGVDVAANGNDIPSAPSYDPYAWDWG